MRLSSQEAAGSASLLRPNTIWDVSRFFPLQVAEHAPDLYQMLERA